MSAADILRENDELHRRDREREALLRAIFDGARDAILIVDEHDRCVDANPAACRRFGMTRGELVGKRAGELGIDTCHVEVCAIPSAGAGRHFSVLRDLSERRMTEQKLREAEQRLRMVISNTPIILFATDRDGRYILHEGQGLEVIGLRPGQLVGESVIGRMRDPERVTALRRALAGERVTGEFEHGGHTFDAVTMPSRDASGEVTGITGIAVDVTDRKRLEDELRASADRNRLLFDASPQPMWVVDLETLRFLDVNRAALERYGYDRDEVLGLTLDAISPTEALPQKLAAAMADGQVCGWPSQHRTKDGGSVDVEVTAHMIEVNGRRALLTAIVDVTERRRMEAALRESEQRYRRIVDNAAEGIFTYDADAKITFANPAMADMLGTSESPVAGRSLFDFTFAEDMAVTLDRVSRRAHGVSERSEARLRRDDGSPLPVRTHAVPLRDSSGRFEGGLVLVSDVTELKRTEEQLRQAAKMEAVGALAGGVAHDFNNLLSIILSYTSMLGDEPLDDVTRGAIHEIHEAGQRAAAVTRQLLAFSRKQMLDPSVVDMNEVVAGLRAMLARLLGARVELVVLPSDAPAKVHVDRGQLEQVLMNLAVNARDAMPCGGRLTLETKITVRAEAEAELAPGTYVSVAVTDTGVGMDAPTQRRIFEPFFTTKEQGKGTGLGLATVYGIVRQSGGQVLVASQPGKGARFEVLIPATERDLDRATSNDAPTGSLRGSETILLVEDDDQVRQVVAAVLRKNGYDVLEAENAGEALLIAEETNAHLDLVLTDVVMPRITGRQLAERLRRVRPDVPVVYMSGYADSALVEGCGADVLSKPLVPSVLLRKLRVILDD